MKTVALLLLACNGLMAWTVTATPKGPNQINLTWSAQPSPGYGYLIEIQSAGDSRYPSYTVLQPIPTASGYDCDPTLVWHGGVAGCSISDHGGAYVYNPSVKGVPTWVVESQYVDPQDGTRAQFIASGLKNNTAYSFRVRTFTGNTSPTYGSYSSVATATTANYTVRYISTTGNDGNLGTSIDDAGAWKTFDKVGTVACGTLLLVKGGDYANEHFGFGNSCAADAKVVLQANYGDTVRVVSNSHPEWGSILNFFGDGNVMDGITIAENYQDDYSVSVYGSRNAIFGSNIGPTLIPTGYGGIAFRGGSNNLVHGSYVHDEGSPYGVQNGLSAGGFLVSMLGSNNNTVWSNHLTRGAHDNGLVHDGSGHKFLNNIADGGWGMAFETVYYNSSNNLFEGIISIGPGALDDCNCKPAFELSYKSNTVRRSIFKDGRGKGIEISSYDNTTNNLVYNNVFYNVNKCYFQSHNDGSASYDGVKVQNNICLHTGDATEIYLPNATPNAISYNVIRLLSGAGTEATVIWNQDAGPPYTNLVTLTYAEANYAPAWAHNAALSVLPVNFVDVANMDFHLADSNLVGVGTQVTDANYGYRFASPISLGAFGANLASGAGGVLMSGKTVR